MHHADAAAADAAAALSAPVLTNSQHLAKGAHTRQREQVALDLRALPVQKCTY
jgi:hypothetical protein